MMADTLLISVVLPPEGYVTNHTLDTTWSITKATGDTEGVRWVFMQTAFPLQVDADDYVMLHPSCVDPKADYDAPYVRTPLELPRMCPWTLEGPRGAKIQLWGTKTAPHIPTEPTSEVK